MAAPLRIVRRSKRAARSLTAASQTITDPRRQITSVTGRRSDNWQEDAWDMLDQVGELRYYVGWRASSCSRCRLIAADVDPETGLPSGATENKRVRDIVHSIAGGPLGRTQLVRRAVECLTVPGEVWLAIIVNPLGFEQWLALTRDEIHTTAARGTEIELPTGDRYLLSPGRDSIFRVWNPHPRKASDPDSPVRATLDPLHEIVRTTKTIANASKSRLIGNGVLFVPQEMSIPANQSPAPAGVDTPLSEVLVGTPAVQQLSELLWQVATTAYDDEDSMVALIPMIATVPGDQTKNISHITFGSEVTDVAIKTRNDAISRLAMGLDVSPERLLGLGGQSNHWSAWQIADEDVQLHIKPVMETFCQAINDQVLRPVLEREGLDPAKFMLWYDAGQLTADPDKADEATEAFDRGSITAEAYRSYLGLDAEDGYDYSTLKGWQSWAADKVSAAPELITTLLPLLPPLEPIADQINPPLTPIEGPPTGEEPITEQQTVPATEGTEPGYDQSVNYARTRSVERLRVAP